MPDTDIVAREIAAQLDDLRIVTITDGEVWSARDLMPFAGYARWEDFSNAINRAIASINTSGLDASDHFRGVPKMIETGKGARRQVEDVELTRYGCYILFQNADARKPEVAALQQYFAVQTRKQELATSALSDDEIVARALQITSNRVKELEAKIAEDAPKVEYVDVFLAKDDVILFSVAASELGVPVGYLREQLLAAGWITKKLIGSRWSNSKGRTVNEYEYYAAAAHRDKFKSKEQLNAPRHHNGQVRTTLYIYPAALPAIRRRLTLTAVSA